MNRKDVEQMAWQAGFAIVGNHIIVNSETGPAHATCTETLNKFANILVGYERESCAMRAWATVVSLVDAETADQVLKAIRARGQE